MHTDLLQQFWGPFHDQVHTSTEVPVRDVIDALDGALGSHLFLPQVSLRLGGLCVFRKCNQRQLCNYIGHRHVCGLNGFV